MKAIDVLQEVKGNIGSVSPTTLEKPSPTKEIQKTTGKQDASSPEFFNKLKGIAERLGVSTSDMLRIMQFETGGTLDPAEGPNKVGAVGLIQFMPSTAKSLGTTTTALRKMTAVEQLDYVEKFYKNNGVTPGMGLGDLYLMTFMPAAVKNNKADDFILGVDNTSKAWNDADKNRRPFPADPNPGLTLGNIWRDNPSFRNLPLSEKPPRDYFTVGDVKNYILGIRHK